jgi:hypothetical protein
MIHSVQLHTELEPHKAVIKGDVINAFNEFDRDQGFEVLQEEYPDCQELVANFYSDEATTTFVAVDGTLIPIVMTAGSSQGDVYGGLLFACAFSKPLRNTIAKFKDRGLSLYAYYDDVYFIIAPRYANALMEFFSRELRKINLRLRPSASAIYLPTGDPPSTMLPDITERNGKPEELTTALKLIY